MKQEINGNLDVKIVKGQAFQLCVEFDGEASGSITSVQVKCSKLNFDHDLNQDIKNTKRWYYNFTSEETSKFDDVITTYTLIVYNSIEEINPLKKIENKITILNDKNEVI